MYIPQYQLNNINEYVQAQKAVIIYGPRRCGKTTLLNKFTEDIKQKCLFVTGEDIAVQDYLSSQSVEKLKDFVGKNELVIIDEAQKVNNIGLNIKLILDNIEGVKVIASGSSSFDLAKQVGEPLTGRKHTLKMYPIAQLELENIENRIQTKSKLEQRLIYGSYPEVILAPDNKKKSTYLRDIISSYLYKDILEMDGIRQSDKLIRLVQLLSFQIGKEVSCNELGTQLGMSKNTVERYLDLLEKSFVIFKLKGFSRNLRKEISKNSRYFFYDIGIRNAVINNFNPVSMRDDVGELWENYIIIEMIKKQEYKQEETNNYFWRTYDQKEIDFIEEKEGRLFGYEIKWADKKKKIPNEWLKTYKGSSGITITQENYLRYII